jgi:hypothetical protein
MASTPHIAPSRRIVSMANPWRSMNSTAVCNTAVRLNVAGSWLTASSLAAAGLRWAVSGDGKGRTLPLLLTCITFFGHGRSPPPNPVYNVNVGGYAECASPSSTL